MNHSKFVICDCEFLCRLSSNQKSRIINRCLVVFLAVATSTVSLRAQSFETILQQGHELAVICVATSPDSNYVATGSRDKSAKLWELSTGREVRSFLGHDYSVTALSFS